jgi:acyl-CoA synthetase (AMP-forming)/AMP-acid ligase II
MGDFVAVFTTNSPEMVVCIYALAKLGAIAPLINTNLRGMPSYPISTQLADTSQMKLSNTASMSRPPS